MKLSLVVLNAGKASGQAIPVTAQQFVIGRDPQCNLRPASVLISKRHCALLLREEKVSVKDFDSTNGTFVNDQQVKGEIPLTNGDTLKVGPLSFKVVMESVAIDQPTPTRTNTIPTPKKPVKVNADEDAAALLLSIDDTPTNGNGSGELIPDGSTVMDMPVKLPTPAPPTKDGEAAVAADAPNPAAAAATAADAKRKEAAGAAQMAAKAILDKYTKRQR